MLERIKHEKTIDVYGHVTCLRAQRNYMVQTEDQYTFIHDALLEAVMSGFTEVSLFQKLIFMEKRQHNNLQYELMLITTIFLNIPSRCLVAVYIITFNN